MAKLSTIYSRAALSTVASTGAYSDLSGLPTLGTAAAAASTDYATAAQGTLADTALQPAALNNTALTGIPTAPTAAEGTNTTQIATTAFVLANSEIDNGIVINGVANFWQSTPPTQRVDGNALQDNDIWYDSTTGRSWIRRGIYWMGDLRLASVETQQISLTSTVTNRTGELIIGDFYLEKIVAYITLASNNNGSNYLNYGFGLSNSNGSITTVATGNTSEMTSSAFVTYNINLAYLNTGQYLPLTIAYARVGTVMATNLDTQFLYRLIYV